MRHEPPIKDAILKKLLAIAQKEELDDDDMDVAFMWAALPRLLSEIKWLRAELSDARVEISGEQEAHDFVDELIDDAINPP